MTAKCQVVGWVSGDVTPVGKQMSVTNFSVGFYTGKKEQDGKSESAFIACSVFGKSADMALEMLHKGDLIFVEGSLAKYTTKEGQDRLTLNGSSFKLLKSKGEATQTPQRQTAQRQAPRVEVDDNAFEADDSEIPF